jgi:RNA polymerase sigma factor (sigma-70 family)
VRHPWVVTWPVSLEDAYRKWADELTRYATALVGSSDAADLVADAFAAMLGRGEEAWCSIGEPRNYLYRVVFNASLMNARGSARRRHREARWSHRTDATELLSDPAVIRALGTLSVQQRSVTFLTYWHDMTPSTVASMLQISEGSVKRHLARARATLREVLT